MRSGLEYGGSHRITNLYVSFGKENVSKLFSQLLIILITDNMIFDNLNNCNLYFPVHPDFEKAFNFLKNTNFSSADCGKIEIENDKIFAMISNYKTKPIFDVKWESHKKYIDIQCLITGAELIGFSDIKNMIALTEYDENKDILFYSGEGHYLTLDTTNFAIFFPQDAHAPCISLTENQENVLKVVIKIKV